MKKILDEFLVEYDIDITNIWVRFMFGYMAICISLVLYFSLVNPVIMHYQNNSISQKQETELMYLVRTVYKQDSKIIYFNMFPIIGGDRVFVVKSEQIPLHFELDNLKWNVNDKKENIYKATNRNYIATFSEEPTNTLVVGGVNSWWSEIWYKIYVFYYLNTIL